MQVAQLGINVFMIFGTWWWSRYYYVFLPFITVTVALNCAMVVSLIFNKTRFTIRPEKKYLPQEPETLVLLMPCYNETLDEMTKSLDSLVAQQGIGHHKQTIMVLCDGKVRGPGMSKTSADYLLEDILVHKDYRKKIRRAYRAWDQQMMDVVVQKGDYKGLPYFCVIKEQNQGKRDSLIVARSFCYNYSRRHEKPTTIFTPTFFDHMAEYLSEAGIDKVDGLVGMDADTLFDKDCVAELLKEYHYKDTVGVCGYVAVDGKGNPWNLWRLYQSAEYTIAQALRRLHQSMVTNKVSCLPGCCQLLKICEETCGDDVLIDRFGYCPNATDSLLKQIRATASEDRNHVCLMLSARPNARTRQALRAKAFTDVPGNTAVFLSQRRRWTLGATSNDLYLVTAPGVQWFERILAGVNVMTWFLNPFIWASIATFIYAATRVPGWIIACFVSVMAIPIVYYLCIPAWLHTRWKERVLFWVGCATYVFVGPFINISVLVYAVFYMDSFGWGKTRKVVSHDADAIEDEKYDAVLIARRSNSLDEEAKVGL
ncbi:chitin synthase-domain-containing protein [Elsinoe ampelina]|uniref:chitin synthase n=1 Tax=Elsinoe ampelina TaxID=302913 RepID=A0A6A6GI43_9PEZI|nr:chitin synthase-domain-containing protein [Elsinoe ampelina]